MRILPASHRPASEQGLGARILASPGASYSRSREFRAPASLCSRLRCLSFQSTTSSATGKQPPSRSPPSIATSPQSGFAAGSIQQQVSAHDMPQAKVPGETNVRSQDSSSGSSSATAKLDADRIQASGDASTSGREYWQVSSA